MTSIQNTLLQMQNDTSRINAERGRANLGSDRLDKNAFMQLLMAKLQNQDPLNPVQDNEFLTQQAQLAQVEQMEDMVKLMRTSNQIGSASTLIGRNVELKNSDGTTVTGKVTGAAVNKDGVAVVVNGTSYKMDQVTKIFGSDA